MVHKTISGTEKTCICHNCECKVCDAEDAKWEDTWYCDEACTCCK